MTFLRKFFRSDQPAEQQDGVAPPDSKPAPEGKGNAPLAEPAATNMSPGAPAAGQEWWDETGAHPAESKPAPAGASGELLAPQGTEQTSRPRSAGTAPLQESEQLQRRATAPLPELELEIKAPDNRSISSEEALDGTHPLSASDTPALARLRSRQGLAAAALRDVGRVRLVNQDSVFALITTLPRESSDLSMGLFVVADGMGGHDSGEIASRLAVSTVARQVLSELVLPALADSSTEALQPLIVSAVQEANRAIWEYAQTIGSDMGTTCTAALMLGHALYVGHVGDSRLYLRRPGGLECITSDHSAVGRLIQVGQLDPEEARDHPLRSQLYRTVGQHPDVAVDFIYQQIGDATHLLLCSDGLWSMLEEDVLLDVLDNSHWPQDACQEFIARANLAGGDDNISAVVVTLPS